MISNGLIFGLDIEKLKKIQLRMEEYKLVIDMLKIASSQTIDLFKSRVDLVYKLLLDFSSKEIIVKISPNHLLMSIVW